MKALLTLLAATATTATPQDFAYRMQVTGTADAAAYRVALPLAVYQKIVHPDLADLRVFNGNGEPVPFAVEQPAAGTIANAATALAIFPLKDDSDATLDAIAVTIESGKSAIHVQAGGGQTGEPAAGPGRTRSYLVDGRALATPVSALRLEWPQDAPDFAGRVRVEASDTLGSWQPVAMAAPIANLHSTAARLVEQRVEFPPTKARFWRLSWSGPAAPFMLTSILGEPAKQSVGALHASMHVAATVAQKPVRGEFEYDLGAALPVDRINLDLPDINTVVDVELLSRAHPQDVWLAVRHGGFYRLKSDGEELRNGPMTVSPGGTVTGPPGAGRYWLVRTNPRQGGLGATAPHLVAEWVPHEVVFVARGAGPFSLAYGSSVAQAAAVSLTLLPGNVAIVPASLANPESSGGESLLQSPVAPFPWKTLLLWAVLIVGAGLLGWMAYRLSKEVARG